MTSVTGFPARTASAIALSRATMRSASATTRSSSAAGMKTTPFWSANTTSPGCTVIPANSTGSSIASCTILPRALTGTTARPNTGNPCSALSAMSRQAPSMTTPPMPFRRAARVRMPPQHDTSVRPSLAITRTSPVSAASIAAAAMCCAGLPSCRGPACTVRTRPVTGSVTAHSGRIPVVAPGSCNVSSASDTAQVSSARSLSSIRFLTRCAGTRCAGLR